MKLESLIQKYNDCYINGCIELEAKVLIKKYAKSWSTVQIAQDYDPKVLLARFQMLRFIEVTQTINMISDTDRDSTYIKTLVFEDGVQRKDLKHYHTKRRICSPSIIPDVGLRVTLAEEAVITHKDFVHTIVRFKHRFTFSVDMWNIDFTFIHQTDSKNIDDLKVIRDDLFKPVDVADLLTSKADGLWKYPVEIEFEFKGDEFKIEYLTTVYNTLSSPDTLTKHDVITKVASLLHTNKTSLKAMLPNVQSLSKLTYIRNIFPYKGDYYLTDKIDGIRTIVIASSMGMTIYNSLECVQIPGAVCNGETVLECEKVGDDIYAYDCLQYEGKSLVSLPFKQRLKYMQCIDYVRVKTYVSLDDVDVKAFYKQHRDYDIDGLIMVPKYEVYDKTISYKWKPPYMESIDFLVKRCPKELYGVSPYIKMSKKDLYILFVNVSDVMYKRLHMKRIQHYSRIFPNVDRYYFPIQFSPSDDYYAYLYWHTEEENIDGCILEMVYDDGWHVMRKRLDKTNARSGTNNYKTAEIIWRNHLNPLTLDVIQNGCQDIYFKSVNNTEQIEIRKFSRYVKHELLKSVYKGGWVVDIGCGRGQDIFKYINHKVSDVLMIDSSEDNLCEVIERKYIIATKQSYRNRCMGIHIQQMDINDDYKDNVSKVHQSGIPISKVDTKTIVCSFAVHYFAENKESIANFTNFVACMLSNGGRLIVICLDGTRVKDYISRCKRQGTRQKYRIQLSESKDNSIDVMLPFSNGELYTEYLMNLHTLDAAFKKVHMRVEQRGYFSDYLTKDDRYLDKKDEEYLEMVNYTVYYKSK